jgi:hypothetical protein
MSVSVSNRGSPPLAMAVQPRTLTCRSSRSQSAPAGGN